MSGNTAAAIIASSGLVTSTALCPVCSLAASGDDEVSARFGTAPSRGSARSPVGIQSWCRHCRSLGKDGLSLLGLSALCEGLGFGQPLNQPGPRDRCKAAITILKEGAGSRHEIVPPVVFLKGTAARSLWHQAFDKRWGDLKADVYASRPRATKGSDQYWKKNVAGPIFRILKDLDAQYEGLNTFRNFLAKQPVQAPGKVVPSLEAKRKAVEKRAIKASELVQQVIPLPEPSRQLTPFPEAPDAPPRKPDPEIRQDSNPACEIFNLLVATIRSTEGVSENAAHSRIVVMLTKALNKGIS